MSQKIEQYGVVQNLSELERTPQKGIRSVPYRK